MSFANVLKFVVFVWLVLQRVFPDGLPNIFVVFVCYTTQSPDVVRVFTDVGRPCTDSKLHVLYGLAPNIFKILKKSLCVCVGPKFFFFFFKVQPDLASVF